MNRVDINPELVAWALTRSRKDVADLAKRFPKLPEWLDGRRQPTAKQLQDFAAATATPLGYLYLASPPDEDLPIPDFRSVADAVGQSPSADLLETIYAMQRRQSWLRETLIENDAEPIPFVGSASLSDSPVGIAREMRLACGLEDGWTRALSNWRDAVSELRRRIESSGVMAVINGIVGNNTHRPLSVAEFRGFALSDDYAPLVFVNGADAKSAQMFTLAHELAHIWLGREGVSGIDAITPDGGAIENFCNSVAAEFLVPAHELKEFWSEAKVAASPPESIARKFKVSPIVAARRMLDLNFCSRSEFFAFYQFYIDRENSDAQAQRKRKSGGDFYLNQNTRVGEKFATEVYRAAKEGRLLYADAYKLTGLSGESFSKYGRRLGFRL